MCHECRLKPVRNFSVLLFFVFLLLLVGCREVSPNATPPSDNPLDFEPVPELGVETQSSSLTAWSPKVYLNPNEDFSSGLDTVVDVEVLGTGLGSRFAASNQATVTVPDPDSVTKLYAQVVFKAGTLSNPVNEFIAPDEIVVSTPVESKSLSAGQLYLAPLTDDAGVVVNNTGRVYETELQPASHVSVDITNIRKFGTLYTPRALIVYVFREVTDYQNGTMSTGHIVNRYLHGHSGFSQAEVSLNVDGRANWFFYPDGSDLEVTFALAELGSDPRHVTLVAEAGGVRRQVTLDRPTDGDEFSQYTLMLPNVPSNAREVVTRVISPKAQPGESVWNNGDSVFWHAVSVSHPYTRYCDTRNLTSQEAVDAALPCTEANRLRLGSPGTPNLVDPITNIHNLRNLSGRVSLHVHNTALTDFDGLQNVLIDGGLAVVSNENLESLSGLNLNPSLHGIGIRNNPKLTSLKALRGLQNLFSLFIVDNDSLITLEGLETLAGSTSLIEISDNASLTDITALQNLLDVRQSAYILDNPLLDCTSTPSPGFLPLQQQSWQDLSTGNLVDCPIVPIP